MLDELWRAADELAASRGVAGDYVLLDECGLGLQRPLARWEYFCTPRNSLTFGRTGCDGVHFGFLQVEEGPIETQPVVMTVPMAYKQKHNLVLAEGLTEFLNLGCLHGWDGLDELVYRPSEFSSLVQAADREETQERDELLKALRKTLTLQPIEISLARIEALEAKYGHLVEAADE